MKTEGKKWINNIYFLYVNADLHFSTMKCSWKHDITHTYTSFSYSRKNSMWLTGVNDFLLVLHDTRALECMQYMTTEIYVLMKKYSLPHTHTLHYIKSNIQQGKRMVKITYSFIFTYDRAYTFAYISYILFCNIQIKISHMWH